MTYVAGTKAIMRSLTKESRENEKKCIHIDYQYCKSLGRRFAAKNVTSSQRSLMKSTVTTKCLNESDENVSCKETCKLCTIYSKGNNWFHNKTFRYSLPI